MKHLLFFAARRSKASILTGPIRLFFAACILAASATSIFGSDIGGKRSFDTMTVNLYIGGGMERIVALDPTDPAYFSNLLASTTSVYYEIVASQPHLRIQRVADEIAARMPDMLSVEEASLIRVQSPGDLVLGGSTPATNVVFDYLQILQDALNARGLHYTIVASSTEWDAEVPILNLQTGAFDDVRQTDREAILARTDLPPGQFRVAHQRSGNFTNIVYFPTLHLPFTRGWCSVDVFLRGKVFRYICAHLEEETFPQLQVLQANELLNGPAKTSLPIVIVGDFNSDPLHRDGSVAYDTLAARLNDAWAVLHPSNPGGGLTWGHDEWLTDPDSLFDRRIDFAFYRDKFFTPVSADVIDLGLNRLEPPLWASDHAAFAAQFRIQNGGSGRHHQ
jgi:endonuclease/exonuclease/phosphatase family metal-dependent hydrolase